MGLFTQRPEEPSEWAGLPSEPAQPLSDAERLGDAGAGWSPDLLSPQPELTTSVEIPVDEHLGGAGLGPDGADGADGDGD